MRKVKKPLIYFLCAVLLSCSILSVRPPQKAYAVAIVDDAAVLLAILIATGIVYVGSTLWRENLDGTVDIDFPWELDDVLGNQWNDLQEEYWKEHNEATGGNGSGSDFDPDNDDPNEKPPKWDKLKEYVKSHGGVAFAAGGALGTIAASFAKKVHDLTTIEDAQVMPIKVADMPNMYIGYSSCGASNPTFLSAYNDCILDDTYLACGLDYGEYTGYMYVGLSKKPPGYDDILIDYIFDDNGGLVYKSFTSYNSNKGSTDYSLGANYIVDGVGAYSDFGKRGFLGDMNVYPFYIAPGVDVYLRQWIFDSTTDYGPIHLLGAETDFITSDNTLTSSDVSDYLADHPDASSLPVADSVRVPTSQELQDFYAQYKHDQQKAIDEIVKKLTSTSTEPEPDNPDESGGGTDKPSESESGAESGELDDYTAPSMITQVFPFCIPFDLIRSVQVLAAPGEAPRWELPLKVERLGIDYTFVIDMSEFEELAVIFRVFMTLLFILSLILVTRALIKG